DLDYLVQLVPDEGVAQVQLVLEDGRALRYLDFNLGDENIYSDFETDGEWRQEGERGVWRPEEGKARLSYRVRIDHQRKNGRFDARMTEDWALFRGDDLVP